MNVWMRKCCYCGAPESGNETGKCRTGFPHCFLFTAEALAVAREATENAKAVR